jgi:hypothetical protein
VGYFLYSDNGLSKMVGCQTAGPSNTGGKVRMGGGGSIETCNFLQTDEDFLERHGYPNVVKLNNVSTVAEYYTGWALGKYRHQNDIPNGPVRWNYNDRQTAATVYGEDYAVVRSSGTGAAAVRATTSKSSGKWYWEVYVLFWSTSGEGPGVANATYTLNSDLGEDTNGISFRSGALRYNAGNTTGMPTYDTGDWLSFALDKDNNKLWVRVNGGNWNNSGSDNPATNTGGYSISVTGALYPTGFLAIEGAGQVFVPQSRRWKYTAPSGFSELT